MRLLQLERDFIALAGLAADLPATVQARQIGIKLHQFHYIQRKLISEGLLKKVWIIDTFKLNLTRYNVFFSLGPTSQKNRSKFVKEVAQAAPVVFFSEIGGDFDFELSVLAASPYALILFLRGLSQQYGEIFFSKVISTRNAMVHFPRKYLSKKIAKIRSLEISAADERKIEVDDLDYLILKTLCEQPMLSRRELAYAIGKPESTVDFRFKALRESGIIKGALWAVQGAKYGAQTYKLLIHAKGFGGELAVALRNFAAEHQHVTVFIEGFGEWDFELGVEVQEYQEITALREQLLLKFGALLKEIKVINRFKVFQYRSFGGQVG